MKVVILAGGLGTRISEETSTKPKPMIEIGDKPILWHIMKTYSYYGYNDFIICLGFKGYVIKEFFFNYFLHNSDVTIDVKNQILKVHNNMSEPWNVTLVDTGAETMTGGRVKRIASYVNNEPFMLTYGDGVGNVCIPELLRTYESRGKIATVTAVLPSGRFGALNLSDSNDVVSFVEKPDGDGGWINGGFFVFNPGIFDYIDGDSTILEREPLERLAADGQLTAYLHKGFWQPMDTLRDKNRLEELWKSGNPTWKVW